MKTVVSYQPPDIVVPLNFKELKSKPPMEISFKEALAGLAKRPSEFMQQPFPVDSQMVRELRLHDRNVASALAQHRRDVVAWWHQATKFPTKLFPVLVAPFGTQCFKKLSESGFKEKMIPGCCPRGDPRFSACQSPAPEGEAQSAALSR